MFAAAFGWGISVYGVFCSWHSAAAQLQGLGADALAFDPMLDYWLRMTAGAFSCIGVFLFVVALSPKRFAPSVPIIGILLFAEGLILLIHGVRLGLDPIPFYADTSFCLLTGIVIWLLRNEAKVQQINKD